jgi:signal transduction histidine kinase
MRHINVISVLFEPCEDFQTVTLCKEHVSSHRAKRFYQTQDLPQEGTKRLTVMDVLSTCEFESTAQRAEVEAQLHTLHSQSAAVDFVCRKILPNARHGADPPWHRVVFNWIRDPGTHQQCLLLSEFDVTLLMRSTQHVSSLRDTQAAVKNFLSVISHELLTPLNAISGLCQAMAGSASWTSRSLTCVNAIDGRAKHLAGLVHSMLEMSESVNLKLIFSKSAVDLHPLIERLFREHQHKLGGSVRLENCVPSDFTVWAEPDKLRQVLDGLLDNATKFTDHGSVSVSARLCDEYALVEVADSGPGIPLERQREVWKPFTQLDMSATRKAGGTSPPRLLRSSRTLLLCCPFRSPLFSPPPLCLYCAGLWLAVCSRCAGGHFQVARPGQVVRRVLEDSLTLGRRAQGWGSGWRW